VAYAPATPEERRRVAIAARLWKLGRAREIPPVWVQLDASAGIYMATDVDAWAAHHEGLPERERLSWEQAERIAAGEAWHRVLGALPPPRLRLVVRVRGGQQRRMGRRY
jgi:hypothetical protein